MPEQFCLQRVWSADQWRPPLCGRKAKFKRGSDIDPDEPMYLCGIHAKRYPDAKPIQQEDGADE